MSPFGHPTQLNMRLLRLLASPFDLQGLSVLYSSNFDVECKSKKMTTFVYECLNVLDRGFLSLINEKNLLIISFT